jgi:hypothetical protein
MTVNDNGVKHVIILVYVHSHSVKNNEKYMTSSLPLFYTAFHYIFLFLTR